MDNEKNNQNNRPKGRKKVVSEGGSGVQKKKPLAGVNPFGEGGVFSGNQQGQAKPQQGQANPSQQSQAAQQAAYQQQMAQQQAQQHAAYQQQMAQQQAQQHAHKPTQSGYKPQASFGGGRPGRSPIGCLVLIILLVILFFASKMMKGLSGGSSNSGASNTNSSTATASNESNSSSSSSDQTSSSAANNSTTANQGNQGSQTNSNGNSGAASNAGTSANAGTFSFANPQGWVQANNSDSLNTAVVSGIRDKYTAIKGNGEDTITLMIYMCGTDLESKGGMGTSDLVEMQSASISDKINIIIYTGGCSRWRNNLVSSTYNQVYQLKNGNFQALIENAGTGSMTDPANLSSFVKWTAQNFPADRYDLILWDHGGGSVSGYGYDEKFQSSGSMNLAGIDDALTDAGVKFDFVGFDACLMATAETALVLADHADYLIASEEVEPGIGWYYTNWLSNLSRNTSLDTVSIGKMIADDFAEKCRIDCPGQETTLSVVDLAELSYTLPSKLAAFSKSTSALIKEGNYKAVANARGGSREFSRSTKIDQIDLVHFAYLMNNQEGKDLMEAVLSAVKYNKTSRNSANAYGLSIYFPYQRLSQVDKVASIYNKIGIDASYTSCIKHFAQMQVSGQATGYGYSSPLNSLFQEIYGSGYSGGQSSQGQGQQGVTISGDLAAQLIESLLSGNFRDFSSLGFTDLDESNTRFLSEEPLDAAEVTRAVTSGRITPQDLVWQVNSQGQQVISMSEEKWSQVQSADLAMYFDDGEGLIELGRDNVFDFDDQGNLVSANDGTWLSIDGYSVAYYHISTILNENNIYVTYGYVPVIYNDTPAQLILVFTDEMPEGMVAGIRFAYTSETETAAKTLAALQEGDKITFVCDYYDYNGNYAGSYTLSDTLTVSDPNGFTIANTPVQGNAIALYRFVDSYGQILWTPVLQ